MTESEYLRIFKICPALGLNALSILLDTVINSKYRRLLQDSELKVTLKDCLWHLAVVATIRLVFMKSVKEDM